MTTKDLKTKIQALHDTFGIPYSFIAKNCEMSGTHINLWLRGDKDMSEKALKRVYDFYKSIKNEVVKL